MKCSKCKKRPAKYQIVVEISNGVIERMCDLMDGIDARWHRSYQCPTCFPGVVVAVAKAAIAADQSFTVGPVIEHMFVPKYIEVENVLQTVGQQMY